jgi:molybdopterin-dependent oxidoreductase alpha subunit
MIAPSTRLEARPLRDDHAMSSQPEAQPDASQAQYEPYAGPAGGWGALKSVGLQLKQQRIPIKGPRSLLATNQADGFDCPGCAWPDRPADSVQFCENGAKAVAAEATAKRATPAVIGQHTLREYASFSDFALEDLGRLTEPLRYDAASDRYRACTWAEAFALIGQQLRALHSPNEALFYTSGRTSNEAAFLWQLFVREYGSNNFPDCSNMCHEPSGVGLKATIGVGKGTVSLDDFALADTILTFGHNPGTNHPRMLGELRDASKRGARIVAFNPLRERGLERFTDPKDALEMARLGATPIASHYLQPRVGSDVALLSALCKRLLELDAQARSEGKASVLDHAFIAEHTLGFEAFAQHLQGLDWATLQAHTGLSFEQLDGAARVYAAGERVICCWGMGITQHQHAVANVEMLAALMLLRGQIGKPGAGLCPIRGHSNVQGDRTMGIDEKPSAAFLDKLDAATGIRAPREPGLATVGAIEAMRTGRARVFIGLGGNFAAATPDTEATALALRQCALTVHISTKFNRSHVVHGREALVLPCLGRTELDMQAGGLQSVTVEDSMSMVHRSTGRNAPASAHLLSEPAIVAGIAQAALPQSKVHWAELVADYGRVRDLIEAVIPGFERFNQRVAAPGGFRLPNAAAERRWATPSARAELHVQPLPPMPASGDGRFVLSTIRSHDQFNTTIYGFHDRYRGIQGGRRVVFMHPADIAALGAKAGDAVDVIGLDEASGSRRVNGFKLVPYNIPHGCIAAYYPETNPLVPLAHHAALAGTPASKSVPVRVQRSEAAV